MVPCLVFRCIYNMSFLSTQLYVCLYRGRGGCGHKCICTSHYHVLFHTHPLSCFLTTVWILSAFLGGSIVCFVLSYNMHKSNTVGRRNRLSRFAISLSIMGCSYVCVCVCVPDRNHFAFKKVFLFHDLPARVLPEVLAAARPLQRYSIESVFSSCSQSEIFIVL